MSVRPVGSVPKSSGSISQVRRKAEAPSGVDASFAELSAAPVQEVRPAASAGREPANGGPTADGGALANIAAAYLIFGGGTTGK
jgi:hypothetical protein